MDLNLQKVYIVMASPGINKIKIVGNEFLIDTYKNKDNVGTDIFNHMLVGAESTSIARMAIETGRYVEPPCLPGTNVRGINPQSLNGFVINVSIDDTRESPFAITDHSGRSKPIRDFIIKFVILDDIPRPLPVFNYSVRNPGETKNEKVALNKQKMQYDSFINEVVLQDTISRLTQPTAICPDVLFAETFTYNNSELQSLVNFLNACKPTPPVSVNVVNLTSAIMDYLLGRISGNSDNQGTNTLGVLVMPTVQNAQTFYDFRGKNPNKQVRISGGAIARTSAAKSSVARPSAVTKFSVVRPSTGAESSAVANYLAHYTVEVPEVVKDVVANIIAQIVVMVIYLNIIHLDLHGDNVLVYKENPEDITYNSKIIDFGRASILNSGAGDVYLSLEQKTQILAQIQILNADIDRISQTDNSTKSKFMRSIMDYIAGIDKYVYQKIVKGRPDIDTTRYQLKWTKEYIKDDGIMATAFNKLYDMRTTPRLGGSIPKCAGNGGKSKKSKQTKKSKTIKPAKKSKKSKTLYQ